MTRQLLLGLTYCGLVHEYIYFGDAVIFFVLSRRFAQWSAQFIKDMSVIWDDLFICGTANYMFMISNKILPSMKKKVYFHYFRLAKAISAFSKSTR